MGSGFDYSKLFSKGGIDNTPQHQKIPQPQKVSKHQKNPQHQQNPQPQKISQPQKILQSHKNPQHGKNLQNSKTPHEDTLLEDMLLTGNPKNDAIMSEIIAKTKTITDEFLRTCDPSIWESPTTVLKEFEKFKNDYNSKC